MPLSFDPCMLFGSVCGQVLCVTVCLVSSASTGVLEDIAKGPIAAKIHVVRFN